MFKGKELGNLFSIISRARSHADFTTFRFARDGEWTRFGQMRIQSVEDGLKKIFKRVDRIRELAIRTNNQEILDILDEEEEILPVHK